MSTGKADEKRLYFDLGLSVLKVFLLNILVMARSLLVPANFFSTKQ